MNNHVIGIWGEGWCGGCTLAEKYWKYATCDEFKRHGSSIVILRMAEERAAQRKKKRAEKRAAISRLVQRWFA